MALLVPVRNRTFLTRRYGALPALLAGSFAFALLSGAAQAQTLEDYAKPFLRPPLAVSSPYSTKPKGNYLLPGTLTKQNELPPLPRKEAVKTPPPLPPKKLPDVRTLHELSDTHPAETPQIFRAATPTTRSTSTYPAPPQEGYAPRFRPAPAPVVMPPPLDVPEEGEWIALDASTPVPPPEVPVTVQQAAPVQPPLPQASITPPPPKVVEYVAPASIPAPVPQAPVPYPAPPPPVVLDIPAPQPLPPVPAAPDAPVIIEKQIITPEPAPLPLSSPHVPMEAAIPALPQHHVVTEVVEIPTSETDAVQETTVENIPLVPVEPIKHELSPASQDILSKTPSGIDSPKTVVKSPQPIILKRSIKPDELDVRSHESLGLKIEVRKAPPDVNAFLQQGYDHLMAGNLSIAAGFYEEAVQTAPKNEQALFGLATTYQRMGRREEARDLYGKLLELNPTHREGLNNFMVLLADESPLAAIDALEQLETENPDFSPIPAQLGSIYNRTGNFEMGARKLARALQLSPDNVAYKYNLAIALDQLGDKKQAADLYMELIQAYNLGEVLPGNVEDIRNRVIFLNR